MAGNARANERDHRNEGPAGGAPVPAEPDAAASPRVTPTRPEPGGARAAPERGSHDASERASHDDPELAFPRERGDDAFAHGIQHDPSPEVARERTAPHEAQTEPDATEAPELGRNPEVEESALPPHEPGSMDISVHEATYERFIGIVIRAVIAIFVILVLLALINA